MKRHGNLWEKITHPDNLYLAFTKARKGKGWHRSIREFEKDIEGNLLKLQKLLCEGNFNTAKYATKTIYEPKERILYKLPFYPDRIVQHALLQIVIPIWDGVMIEESYACRVGRGMHTASKKTMEHVRKYKYCMKADIRKFYPSIDHDILFAIVKKKIKCKETLNLLENIIRSFEGGKNTPIGNYTSQWFGNLYMNELDQLVKHHYNVKPYIRYCDDFILFSDDKQKLHRIAKEIEVFLLDKLALIFSRCSVFPVSQGVDFLGYRHFRNKILLRKSTAKRVQKRMERLPMKLANKTITLDQYRSSIASTEGWLKWACTYNLRINLGLKQLKAIL